MALIIERPPFYQNDVLYDPYEVSTATILASDEASVVTSGVEVTKRATGRYYVDLDEVSGLVYGTKYFVKFEYKPFSDSTTQSTNVGFTHGGFLIERPPFLQADVPYDPFWVGSAVILRDDEQTEVIEGLTVTKRATGRYYVDGIRAFYDDLFLLADTKYFLEFQYRPFSPSEIQTTLIGFTLANVMSGAAGLEVPFIPTLSAMWGMRADSLEAPMPTISASMTAHGVITAALTVPAPTMSAQMGYRLAVTAPAPTISATATAGTVITGAVTAPMPTLSAGMTAENVMSASLTVPMPTVSASMSANPYMTAALTVPMPTISESSILAGTVMSAALEVPMPTLSATGHATFGFEFDLTAPMPTLSATMFTGTARTLLGIVANIESFSLTEYDGLNFNSMAYFNGVYLGASSAGLFTFGGDDDDGTNIDMTAELALSDQGARQMKRLSDVYLSFNGNGANVRVKTDGDSVSESYQLRPNATGAHAQRLKLARGMKSRYYGVELKNINGGALDVDGLELNVHLLGRKVS